MHQRLLQLTGRVHLLLGMEREHMHHGYCKERPHAVTEVSTGVVGPGRSHTRGHSITLPGPTCERRHRTYMSVPGPHPALSPPSLYLSALLSSASLPPSVCPFSTRPSPASSPPQASRGRAWSSAARTSGPALRRRRSPVRHTKLFVIHICKHPRALVPVLYLRVFCHGPSGERLLPHHLPDLHAHHLHRPRRVR